MTAALIALLVAAAPDADPRRQLLDAMAAELARNHAELKLRDNKPPYFISYQMKDYDQREVSARYGALFQDDTYREPSGDHEPPPNVRPRPKQSCARGAGDCADTGPLAMQATTATMPIAANVRRMSRCLSY